MSLQFTLAPEPEFDAREKGRLMFAGQVDLDGPVRDCQFCLAKILASVCAFIQSLVTQTPFCVRRASA